MLYGRSKKSSFSCRLRKRAWILAVNNWYSKDFIANIFVSWFLNLLWGFFFSSYIVIFKGQKEQTFVLFFSQDLYGTIVYLQGKRKDGSSPFLDDFGRNITFFNWKENEPSTHDRDVYIRTTAANYALMEVSTGSTYKNFICFIM